MQINNTIQINSVKNMLNYFSTGSNYIVKNSTMQNKVVRQNIVEPLILNTPPHIKHRASY